MRIAGTVYGGPRDGQDYDQVVDPLDVLGVYGASRGGVERATVRLGGGLRVLVNADAKALADAVLAERAGSAQVSPRDPWRRA